MERHRLTVSHNVSCWVDQVNERKSITYWKYKISFQPKVNSQIHLLQYHIVCCAIVRPRAPVRDRFQQNSIKSIGLSSLESIPKRGVRLYLSIVANYKFHNLLTQNKKQKKNGNIFTTLSSVLNQYRTQHKQPAERKTQKINIEWLTLK